jgi:hypothetical protein
MITGHAGAAARIRQLAVKDIAAGTGSGRVPTPSF